MAQKHLPVEKVDDAALLFIASATIGWVTIVVGLLGQLTSPWVFLPAAVSFAAFLRWFSRSYTNVCALEAERRWAPRWAVGAFIVPGVNLVLPIMLAADLWRTTHRLVGARSSVGALLAAAVAASGVAAGWCGWQRLVVPTLVLGTACFTLSGYYVLAVSRQHGALWRLTWEERVRNAGKRAHEDRSVLTA